MKISSIIALTCLIFEILAIIGFAHGIDRHGMDDPQMKRLHAMMPMFSEELAKLEGALKKGDAALVQLQCDKILRELLALKKSRPHKNAKERKKFVELATNLETSVIVTANLVQRGDLAAGRGAFKRIEATCIACHAKFRD